MSLIGSDLELSNQSMGNKSDTSRVSFQPDYDGEELDDEIHPPPNRPKKSPRIPKASVRDRIYPNTLLNFSDDPDDNIDKDIANIPLDYGRSDQTLARGSNTYLKWSDAEEALR
ncbi:hypothetical protein N7507_003535 [Penicillium longicatenatum]|nr:hypothetical protein N7507_003535 [Penicillium longicatenatum]